MVDRHLDVWCFPKVPAVEAEAVNVGPKALLSPPPLSRPGPGITLRA